MGEWHHAYVMGFNPPGGRSAALLTILNVPALAGTLAPMGYLYLSIAIVTEVIATSALQASNGFTRLWPSAVTVLGYAVAFYCLSLTLRTMPVGIAYAIWSGVGIVLIALVGWLLYRQALDAPAIIGIALIIAGVLVINVFSRTVSH